MKEPTAPCTYQDQTEEWFKASGITRERFKQDMEVAIDCREAYLSPILAALIELPETPVLEAIKRQIDAVILSPHKRARDPISLFREMMELQAIAFAYARSHGTRTKKAKAVAVPEGVEELKEIDPDNKTQERAMKLLRQLKLNPGKALHTEACKTVLESSEGVALDSKVVRRAMEGLAEIYEEKVTYEKIDGSYRIRINT